MKAAPYILAFVLAAALALPAYAQTASGYPSTAAGAGAGAPPLNGPAGSTAGGPMSGGPMGGQMGGRGINGPGTRHVVCKDDVQTYCKDIQPGGGRILDCLKDHYKQLSDECYQVLQKMSSHSGPGSNGGPGGGPAGGPPPGAPPPPGNMPDAPPPPMDDGGDQGSDSAQ